MLARRIARRYRIPMIAKDTIKESLLDVLNPDGARSREMSDASFAVMLAIARELLGGEVDLVLEGNFRSPQHEAGLLTALAGGPGRMIQVLCRAEETVRLARLAARRHDPARHPGHRQADQILRAAECDTFLELPGERLQFDSCAGAAAGNELLAALAVALSAR